MRDSEELELPPCPAHLRNDHYFEQRREHGKREQNAGAYKNHHYPDLCPHPKFQGEGGNEAGGDGVGECGISSYFFSIIILMKDGSNDLRIITPVLPFSYRLAWQENFLFFGII